MNLHELQLRLQQHFTDGLVTIVGSGLSCAEGMPGMTALARHLRTVIGETLTPTDAEHWGRLSPLIEAKGLEAALLELAPTPTLEAELVARTAELLAARERGIVAEVFARKRTLRFTRLLSHLLKPEKGVPVVTTNYDRLIELAAEEADLGVDTMFVGQFAGSLNEQESRSSFCRGVALRGRSVQRVFRPRVNVFKPHGSLDWYDREGKPVRYSGDLSAQRLIITPGRNKFRNGYESPFDLHRERANSAIDNGSRFLVIGYGFNDDHLETHLTPRIRGGIPTLLLTHELSPNAVRLARECTNVTAIQRDIHGGQGSTVFVQTNEIQVPEPDLWDLNSFICKVLEP